MIVLKSLITVTKFSKAVISVLTLFLITSFLPKLLTNQFPNAINKTSSLIHDFTVQIQQTEEYANLLASKAVTDLAIPVLGVNPNEITDTWGAARSNGRVHEGVDIFAPSGTYVILPTKARVSRVGYGNLGGNFVFATGPGAERYYFAHLNQIDPLLQEGRIYPAGTIVGTVGNTGNAIDTPPHLHFGIYTIGGAVNPYPRLQTTFKYN